VEVVLPVFESLKVIRLFLNVDQIAFIGRNNDKCIRNDARRAIPVDKLTYYLVGRLLRNIIDQNTTIGVSDEASVVCGVLFLTGCIVKCQEDFLVVNLDPSLHRIGNDCWLQITVVTAVQKALSDAGLANIHIAEQHNFVGNMGTRSHWGFYGLRQKIEGMEMSDWHWKTGG
jgi:hypothetical protein